MAMSALAVVVALDFGARLSGDTWKLRDAFADEPTALRDTWWLPGICRLGV